MTSPSPISQYPRSQQLGPKPLIAASLVITLAILLRIDIDELRTFLTSPPEHHPTTDCNNVISNTAKLSREQLAQLLTIPERDTKERVRQIISEPYCQLPTLKIRSGVDAEREAYPLAFDPDTTLIILYENNEYAGYRFGFE